MAPQLDPVAIEAVVPGLPTVLVNCLGESVRPSLMVDNAGGIEAVVEHFVAVGRRRIVHLAGPTANRDARERADAYRVTLARLLPGTEPIVIEGDFLERSGAAAIAQLVVDGVACDAVCAANDMMALGAIGALREREIHVPDQVAVAGFDDIPLSRYLGVTTVAVRMDALGARAIARLANMLGGEEDSGEIELIRPALVVRGSSERQE